jgi:hypothetical protein
MLSFNRSPGSVREWKWMARSAASAARRGAAAGPGAGLHESGEEHTETGATPRPVSYLDATAMRQDDGLANRHPQPVTGHV